MTASKLIDAATSKLLDVTRDNYHCCCIYAGELPLNSLVPWMFVKQHDALSMGVGRGAMGAWAPPGFWNFQPKKVDFLVLSGKKQFHYFWPPLTKILPTPVAPSRHATIPHDALASVKVTFYNSVKWSSWCEALNLVQMYRSGLLHWEWVVCFRKS